MIKKYTNKKGYSITKIKYYIIEEHQTAYNRWVNIGAETYGIDKEHGEFTACGECWQKTGQNGTFDKEHALNICRKLNEALKNGNIYECFNNRSSKESQIERFNRAKVTEFRVVEVIKTTKNRIVTEE